MIAIVNINPNWGIGSENRLLVRIHADMRRFRALTQNNTVIFGRKTLETFPNGDPLPNRNNIVLTRDPDYQKDGLTVCHGLNELKTALSGLDPGESCLYKNKTEGKYYLLIYADYLTPGAYRSLCMAMSDFSAGEQLSPSMEAYMEEHFDIVIPEHALQSLREI